MRVLVSGASGFVGAHLVRALLARGDHVVAICRPGRADATLQAIGAAVPVIEDTGEVQSLAEDVATHHIEAAMHLAARFDRSGDVRDIDELVDSNIGFAARFAAVAATSSPGAPFVNVGSIWQHLDNSAYDPVSLYGATKQAFEDILVFMQNTGSLDVRTVVLPDTYGPADARKKILSQLVDSAVTGRAVRASSGDGVLDLVHAHDVIRGLLDAVEPGVGSGRWILSSGTVMTVRELASLIGAIADRPVSVEWGARPDPPRHMGGLVSSTPLLPNWRPGISLSDGLHAMLIEAAASVRYEPISSRNEPGTRLGSGRNSAPSRDARIPRT